MNTPTPKKSALPPARVGLLLIVLGVALYGLVSVLR